MEFLRTMAFTPLSALPLVSLSKVKPHEAFSVYDCVFGSSLTYTLCSQPQPLWDVSAMVISGTEDRILQSSSTLSAVCLCDLFSSYLLQCSLSMAFSKHLLLALWPTTSLSDNHWTLSIDISLIRTTFCQHYYEKNITISEPAWSHIHSAEQNHSQLVPQLALTSMSLPIYF